MSGLDGLRLDADGYIDMDQFPDDGTDLAGPDVDQLRDALHADPVEEPTPEQWDAMFDEVLATEDTGPFAVDEVAGLDGDDGLFSADGALDAGEEPSFADDPAADDGADDGTGLADVTADDLDVDVTAGLDLAPDDAVDDAFAADALDDAPADVADNDFEDLL